MAAWSEKLRRRKNMRFTGKTAIVTGLGTGVGEAIALRFVEEGAKVGGHKQGKFGGVSPKDTPGCVLDAKSF